MTIRKGKLGEDHLETLSSMENPMPTYGNQCRFSERVSMEAEVSTPSKVKLGEAHSETLCSMKI